MATIETHVSGSVLTIELNRPTRLNALNATLLEELSEALSAAEDPAVRAVLLTGRGGAFSAGQDLQEAGVGGLDYQEHLERYNRIVLQMRRLPKPVVAAIEGVAAGAGMALTLAADMRVAGRDAVFVTAFARIGLVPDSGMTFTLPRTVGWGRAFELLALSPEIPAERALELGLVNRLSEPGRARDDALTLARELAGGPTRTYALIKEGLNASARLGLEETLELEAQLQKVAGSSSDHREGVAAFLEKRRANFEGR